MTGPKANQNPSTSWCTHCNDLQITANQIIFHIFQEKSRGLHTRLPMVHHRRPFSDSYWGEGALVHRLHPCLPWHDCKQSALIHTCNLLLSGLLEWILNSSISRANHIYRVCKFYWWVESLWLLLHKFWSHFGIFGVKYHNEKSHFQTFQHVVIACIHYRYGYTK